MLNNYLSSIDTSLFNKAYRRYLYILVIPILALFLFCTKKYSEFPWYTWVFDSSMIIFCLILGWPDIKAYLVLKGSWKETFKHANSLYAISSLFGFLGYLILNKSDFMGIESYEFNTLQYFNHLGFTPLIAISEEFLKLLVFIFILRFLSFMPRYLSLVLSVLITSYLFGLAHVIQHTPTAWFPIAFSTLPYFLFFLYYRTLLPLILAHFVFDAIGFTVHWVQAPHMGNLIAITLYVMAAIQLGHWLTSVSSFSGKHREHT